jgi:hypothetical protein
MIKNPYRFLLLIIGVLIIMNGMIANNITCGNMPGSMCWGSGWRSIMWDATTALDICAAALYFILAMNEIYKMIIIKLKGKQK